MSITTLFSAYENSMYNEIKNEVGKIYNSMPDLSTISDYGSYDFGFNEYQYKHIINLQEIYGFTYDEIIEAIAGNPVAAASIIGKIPSRAGWQEKAQFDSIANWNNQSNVFSVLVNLPNNGRDARFITKQGNLTVNCSESSAKSLDFLASTYDGFEIAMSAKYTKMQGGAQDNQRRDLTAFAESSPLFGASKTIVALIADGEYYLYGHRDYGSCSDFFDYIECNFCNDNAYQGKRNLIVSDTEHFDEKILDMLVKLRSRGL